MKNGIAINVKFEIPENILCAPVTRVLSNAYDGSIASIDDNPILIAIGNPRRSVTIKTLNIINAVVNTIFLCLL